jgi:uncharacterized Fe-S cluster-containing protein
MDIKRRYPDAKTVFIGPCVSKMDEADRYAGIVDAVLTFEDLSAWFAEKGITPEQTAAKIDESRARLFPTAGGILATMDKIDGYSYISVDGMENCIEALSDIESGNVHKCFIEMSACAGSCIGGPIREKYSRAPMKDRIVVDRFAGKKDFSVPAADPISLKKGFDPIQRSVQIPTEHELLMILRRMGKFKPSDELNCGTCGYNTCREKAIAIYQGKAEPSMCLPFLKDKAESFSDTIVKNTPNGLIVLNEELEVQQINDAARGIMNIRSASDILGDQVIRILDPAVFMQVLTTRQNVSAQKVYLAEYKRYVEQSVVYDKDSHLLVCIMRDITDEENERERKEHLNSQTVEIADRVVERQMRIVQEIASLLGETAAETKIALTKLKESISDE